MMMDQTDLGRLEEMVDSLLAGYNRVKDEKSQLLATLEAKEREIEELQISLAKLSDEKGDVRQKISSILGSIEDWEKGKVAGSDTIEEVNVSPEDSSVTESPMSEESEAEEQAQLFSLKG